MILVTGATGFVGRHVLSVLRDRGHPVRAVVRPGESESEVRSRGAEAITSVDLFRVDRYWWKEALDSVDTVIHLAWYTEPGKYLASPRNLDCLEGSLEMARVCAEVGTRRVVGVGSCAEYDLTAGMLSVATPLNPGTLYATCKAATFQVAGRLLGDAGTEFAWCRLFYLFGAGEDERRLVPYLRKQLSRGLPAELTSGNQIRDFLDVRLAAEMIVEVALGSEQGAVNICSGRPITIRQLAESIADEYGRRDLLRFGARSENLFDPPCVVGVRGTSGS